MSDLISQAEFARHRGVSRKSVSIWKQRGYLVWRDGKIDRDASDELLDSRGTPGNGAEPRGNSAAPAETGNVTPADSPEPPQELQDLLNNAELLTTAEAERVKENYLARQRKLQYERDAGELVRIHDAEREHADRCQRIRSRILALPDEVAAAIAQRIGGNAGEVRAIVQKNVNDVLEELAHGHGGRH